MSCINDGWIKSNLLLMNSAQSNIKLSYIVFEIETQQASPQIFKRFEAKTSTKIANYLAQKIIYESIKSNLFNAQSILSKKIICFTHHGGYLKNMHKVADFQICCLAM